MQVTAVFQYECGEKTCASEPGKFCKFLGVSGKFGKYSHCLLYNVKLNEADGWVQRCNDCLGTTTV